MTNALLFGSGTAIVSFGYTLLLFFLGFHGEKLGQAQWLGWVGFIILLAGIYLGIVNERKDRLEDDQPYGYGNAFVTGMLTSLVCALISAILGWIYFVFINPDMLSAMYDLGVPQLEEKGMSVEQIDQGREFYVKFMPVMLPIMGLFMNAVIGIIASLIIAIFGKAKSEEAAA